MKDVIEKSNSLIVKMRDSIKEIERAEAEKEVIADGRLAIYQEHGGTMYITCLSEVQLQKVKDFIFAEIDNNSSNAQNFLNRMLGNDTEIIQQPTIVIPEKKVYRKEYNKDLVVSELTAGKSMKEVHDEYYPDTHPSWLYKKLKKDGVDYNSIITKAYKEKCLKKPSGVLEEYAQKHEQTLEDYNSDDWVDMGVDAPDQEDTWGLASSSPGKDKV